MFNSFYIVQNKGIALQGFPTYKRPDGRKEFQKQLHWGEHFEEIH